MAGARVLLADDNEIHQEVAAELLRGADIQIDTAPDGQVALEMIRREAYDLMLMVVQMPVVDGAGRHEDAAMRAAVRGAAHPGDDGQRIR